METNKTTPAHKLFTVDYQVLGTRDGEVHKAGTVTLAMASFWDVGPILQDCLKVNHYREILRITRVEVGR